MIPIRDTIRSRTFPLVNWLIVAANALVFLYEISLPPAQFERLILNFGLVPARLHLYNPASWILLLTHMFLHSGWFHILSNMWVLIILGDNVEDRLGPGRYLTFYLLGGFAAAALQVAVDPSSRLPAIGASGAIAAVMGAYFFFYPRARVTTLILLFIIPWFFDIPAWVFLGFWFLSQFFNGFLAITTPGGLAVGGVAWFAHIGGFLFGLLLGRLFAPRVRDPQYHADEYYPW